MDTREISVVLLTGMDDVEDVAGAAGADALLLKPFRPLELLGVVERLAGAGVGAPMRRVNGRSDEEQLVLYARDLRHLVEIERAQRGLLESAYKETVSALASALGTKDTGTRQHSQRVQRYALELTRAIDPELADDPALEYGFLLHDIGKIGVPDQILLKPVELNEAEWRVMKAHTVLGAQMIAGVAFLHEAGVQVVRSHHERWDGAGYPDGLVGEEIPLGARIFAVADAVDAITNHRPYRAAPQLARLPPRDRRGEGEAVRSDGRRRLLRPRVRAARDPQGVPGRGVTGRARSRSTACGPSSRQADSAAMDFALTADQREIQALAREVAQAEIEPNAAAWDREHRFPTELYDKLGELGLMGVCVPSELRRRRGRLPLLHPRARGALARRCRCRRHRRRAHERVHAPDPRVRHRRAA